MAVNALQQAKAAAAQQAAQRQGQQARPAAQANSLMSAFAQALNTLSQHIAMAPKQVQQSLAGHPFIQSLGQAGIHLAPILAIQKGIQQNGLNVQMGTPDANNTGAHYGVSSGKNNIGFYTEPGAVSFGGSVWPSGLPQVGGTIGVDHGSPFGSMNVNGNILGQFGPGSALPQRPAPIQSRPVPSMPGYSGPPNGQAVLGARTVMSRAPIQSARPAAKPAPRPPAPTTMASKPLPYAEWKNTRGYDTLMKKGLL